MVGLGLEVGVRVGDVGASVGKGVGLLVVV